MRPGLFAGLALATFGAAATASAEPPPDPKTPAVNANAKRPGRYRLGPFYVTPFFRIGTIGFDTNVFFTPTERTADATASGGPGLDVVLPLPWSLQLRGQGTVSYLYWLRTASQRRLTGSATGGVDWQSAGRLQAAARHGYSSSFARTEQIDRRVAMNQQDTHVDLRCRLMGKLVVSSVGERIAISLPEDQFYLGTDLRRSLTENRYAGRVVLEYLLTIRTGFFVAGEHQAHRFPLAAERDGDSDAVTLGLHSGFTSRVSYGVSAGKGWFRLRQAGTRRPFTSVDANGTINISPRMRLTGLYRRSLQYSALDTVGGTPTMMMQLSGAQIDRDILGTRLNLQLGWSQSRFRTDSPVAVVLEDGTRSVIRRDDTFNRTTAALAYRFRGHLSIGVTAGYGDRQSNFSDFGVHGLLMGATVAFSP